MSKSKRTSSDLDAQKTKHVKHAILQDEGCALENEASSPERLLAENVQHCTIHITRCKKDYHENGERIEKHIYRKVCALANSGGGALILDNADYEKAKPKDLDIFWQRIIEKLKSIISPSSYGDVFDVSGKFNDEKIILFVKATGHLCTVNSHLYLACETSVTQASYMKILDIMKSQKKSGEHVPTNDLSNLPKFDADKFEYDKAVNFHEGKQIQFTCKCYESSENALADEKIGQCMSAFANCDGGEIFIGIEDETSKVYGQAISDQGTFAEKIGSLVNKMYWGFLGPQRGTHWDVKFFPVQASPPNTVVTVVYIAGMQECGGVFHKEPESYRLMPVMSAPNEEGELYSPLPLGIKEWKQKILPVPEKDWHKRYQELLSSFKRMDPSGIPLLMVKNAVKEIREAFFPGECKP